MNLTSNTQINNLTLSIILAMIENIYAMIH